ncbi:MULTISPECIES: type II secretion system inner membrane protein GspF [Sphingomonas]|uniref:General secretion pathway protein F n=1 Tax=Sphingomonas carotinifaciens TaxID=1166323 RepID=A0A1G7F8G2_9SPHN|nr:type II secretion system inner membrane protein GspF [Sphingomonas carotinifaciens]MBB4085930.1 general secretion pathway protein F [Sphingomonas carotinifaciens]MWC45318.1 type II secretion system inner membrane protein GspF [Sphingomonas carotinifaciens]SDE72159.1 general secretion pathway protein F [Sphingomonas carotinifaciens]
MADFDYVAIDTKGAERRGHVAAADADAARAALDRQRLYVVSLKPGSAPVAGARPLFGLQLGRPRMSGKQLTLFTRQLATLNRVSPLEESLRTITRQTETDKVRGVVSAVHAGVVEGRRLADAMAREPKSFPPLYRAMVAAGESSGTLPTILERLAALLERQAEIRGKLITALAYPTILALVALGVVTALMMFVVPQVVEQFDTVGQELPFLTRMVIGVSDLLVGWWWLMLLFVVLAGLGGWQALKVPSIRLSFDSWLLRVPLLGRLLRDLHAARMARTLGTMVASRLPLLEGLTLTAGTIHNRRLRVASDDIVEAIRGGGSLSAAMRRASVFPPLLTYLAASGEAAGRLDEMLERAADYLEREFDRFTATALSLLEPAIIVVMGGIVATIVLSILLPILQLNTLAGQ